MIQNYKNTDLFDGTNQRCACTMGWLRDAVEVMKWDEKKGYISKLICKDKPTKLDFLALHYAGTKTCDTRSHSVSEYNNSN